MYVCLSVFACVPLCVCMRVRACLCFVSASIHTVGASVESTLDGVNVRADLFPETSKKVPDVNFFYRYAHSGIFLDFGE